MPTTLKAPVRPTEALRRTGNPFRNYFARNPDDDVCSRYHVAELYAREREQLLALVDLYRQDGKTHSEVVPVLGNKGAGKTHLLHSLKHGPNQGWQLVVTPGSYQKSVDFAEYVLFQIIDTVLGGTKQRGKRPIEFIGEELTRRLLTCTLENMPSQQRQELFQTAAPFAKWVRRMGIGSPQAQERCQWLMESLARPTSQSLKNICAEAQLDVSEAADAVCAYIEQIEPRSTAGQMRRRICQGFIRATLLGQEAELADFLTDGFANLEFQVSPSRQDLVLNLSKALMEVLGSLKIPVVVAFDQLEDLLLVRRTEDGHKISESFFAGIVQLMHRVEGMCILIFAERGLWNRFVPSLDGYIQDRLNNPVHLPGFGTIKALKLDPPPAHLVWQVVAARMRPSLEEMSLGNRSLSAIFPFNDEQISRISRTEPTLRDMLQQFRHLFDHIVYGGDPASLTEPVESTLAVSKEMPSSALPPEVKSFVEVQTPAERTPPIPIAKRIDTQEAIDMGLWPRPNRAPLAPVEVKPTAVKTMPAMMDLDLPEVATAPIKPTSTQPTAPNLKDVKTSWTTMWQQEVAASLAQLAPEGALTGASRELQAGLGSFLSVCQDHGVKVGPWRLIHTVPEWTFGDHPTYGCLSIAHWAGKDGKPWRLGVGLFLGRGPGKPRDLAIKLSSFEGTPCVLDQLILLRPSDDVVISGKSKTLWEECTGKGRIMRLESVDLSGFAILYAFPRWLKAVQESLGEGQPLPNLADILQECCPGLLEQVCLPLPRD